MAASKLPALARPIFVPDEYRCAACQTPNAGRGFGERFYCTPCVPPHLREPHEPGYAPLAQHVPAPIAALPAQAAFDLLPGSAPA